MDWAGRTVALVGLGRSNLSAARYLSRHGARLVGFDVKTPAELGPRYRDFASLPGLEFRLGPGYLEHLRGFEVLVLTPGIKKHLPELERARAEGALLTSETALFLAECRAPVIGITGSAGKTTTTSLVGAILRPALDHPVFVGGNIGEALLDQVEAIPSAAWVVLELSSFQLQLVCRSPHLGALLNLFPSHLDVHRSYEEYVAAKTAIFRYQRPGDCLVYNADDAETAVLARTSPSRSLGFSRHRAAEGAFVREGVIVYAAGGPARPVLPTAELRIPGEHNIDNALAATVLAGLAGAKAEDIAQGLAGFAGVEHRLEPVRELGGVCYVNDSIATSPHRTVAALAALPGPVVLIAGGYDRGQDFGELAQAAVDRVRAVVTLGATGSRVAAAFAEHGPAVQVVHARDLAEAVTKAAGMAQPGDVVLLSPASASFDMFTDFEARGRAFKDLVHALR